MPEYPSGTVAFLFTDIEGSTARWEHDAPAMWQAVERHFDLLQQVIAGEHGVLFKKVGDAVQAAFPSVPAAVRAAIAGQHALDTSDFQAVGQLQVRMAIHVGEATPIGGDYLAPVLNRLARVLGAGYGEQILLTEAACVLATPELPAAYALRDLGAHRLKDLLVAERVYQLTGPGLREVFPPLKSLDQRPHNLPSQPTELIGRETELERLRALLTESGSRLVTLTGPGGTGKSRLAVQAAADLLEDFPDGVWWAPLAAITDPTLVPAAIATPLGLRERPGQSLLDTLTEHLRDRKALLVLDNLEQVLGAAPMIGELLARAPGVAVLATSREPLRLRGEREVLVAPLALPPPDARLSPEDALAFPAVRLFVERAQAVKPAFALTVDNLAAVIAICRHLDALPLAIELAAVRIRLLAPGALLARLEHRLPFLTSGPRDLPQRQQTLRAAIAWSYDLLEPAERTLFARLSAFVGGCSLEAALAVVEAGAPIHIDLLDGLEGLVQKSLLRHDTQPDDESRFSMLETIREFALEQLVATQGEETAVRSAHAAYFHELVDQALDSEDQVAEYDKLEMESGNLRAVLDWQERHGESMAALEFATNLRWFWWLRGHLREGQAQLESVLRKCPSAPAELRARAYSGLGALLEASGDFRRAKDSYALALDLSRNAGDQPGIAEALDNLGTVALNEGNLPLSESLWNEALELRRVGGLRHEIAGSLINLGTLAYQRQDFDHAIALYEEARSLSVEAADQMLLAISLGNIGGTLIRKARSSAAQADVDMNIVAEMEASASVLIRQALSISRDLGDRERILDDLIMLADIAASVDPKQAALLLGAAAALAAATGHHLASVDPGYHAGLIDSARTNLGEAVFNSAWQAGEQLSLEDAINAALELADTECG